MLEIIPSSATTKTCHSVLSVIDGGVRSGGQSFFKLARSVAHSLAHDYLVILKPYSTSLDKDDQAVPPLSGYQNPGAVLPHQLRIYLRITARVPGHCIAAQASRVFDTHARWHIVIGPDRRGWASPIWVFCEHSLPVWTSSARLRNAADYYGMAELWGPHWNGQKQRRTQIMSGNGGSRCEGQRWYEMMVDKC